MSVARKWAFLTLSSLCALAGCGPLDAEPLADAPQEALSTRTDALPAASPTLYAGVYRQGSGGHYLWVAVDWASFVAKNNELYNVGLRLIDLNVHEDEDGVTRYDGVWRAGSGLQAVHRALSSASLVSDQAAMEAQGLRTLDVEAYRENGQVRFAAVYGASPSASMLKSGSWTSFVSQWETASEAGWRLTEVESYLENGTRKWLGVFRPGNDGHALWAGDSHAGFVDKVNELKAQGLRLVDMNVYWESNSWRYTGVFRQAADLQSIQLNKSWEDFAAGWDLLSNNGYRLIDFQSYRAPAWARELGKALEGKAVGYSYALVESGQITASGGVGYSRAPWESVLPSVGMTASTRVHLASVSKPITAVALMDLTEKFPNVDLDDPFYPYVQSRWPVHAAGVQNVTLRQLLTHKSGMKEWGYCGDNYSVSMAQLLATPLAGTPGVTEQYSNGNFCLVRAVIEAVSGQSYVNYVKNNVLAPMGITQMSCTPDSTLYYKQGSSGAGYFWSNDYSSHCAAYGWYASATDLAKFLIGVRNNVVLSAWTTAVMNAGKIGWWDASTAGGTAYHHNGAWVTGDGRGCNTGIMRFPNGVEGVVLSNTDGFDTIGMMLDAYNASPFAR